MAPPTGTVPKGFRNTSDGTRGDLIRNLIPTQSEESPSRRSTQVRPQTTAFLRGMPGTNHLSDSPSLSSHNRFETRGSSDQLSSFQSDPLQEIMRQKVALFDQLRELEFRHRTLELRSRNTNQDHFGQNLLNNDVTSSGLAAQIQLLESRLDDLAHRVDHLAREQSNTEDLKQKLEEAEGNIQLLTLGFRQCYRAFNTNHEEMSAIRQVIENMQRNKASRGAPSFFSGFCPPPSSDPAANLFNWNDDSFSLDLAQTLGSDTFFGARSNDWVFQRPPDGDSASVNSFIRNNASDPPGAALNNQVLPGSRANNYWDNFRSFSHQNRLSSTSNTNPLIAQVPPQKVDRNTVPNGEHQVEGLATGNSGCRIRGDATANSPTPPRRKQKINREQNRSFAPTNTDPMGSLSESEVGLNHMGAAARIPPTTSGQQTNRNPHARPDSKAGSSNMKECIMDSVTELIAQNEQEPDQLENILRILQMLDNTKSTSSRTRVPIEANNHSTSFSAPSSAASRSVYNDILVSPRDVWTFNDDEDIDNERDIEAGNRIVNSCKVTSNKRLHIPTSQDERALEAQCIELFLRAPPTNDIPELPITNGRNVFSAPESHLLSRQVDANPHRQFGLCRNGGSTSVDNGIWMNQTSKTKTLNVSQNSVSMMPRDLLLNGGGDDSEGQFINIDLRLPQSLNSRHRRQSEDEDDQLDREEPEADWNCHSPQRESPFELQDVLGAPVLDHLEQQRNEEEESNLRSLVNEVIAVADCQLSNEDELLPPH